MLGLFLTSNSSHAKVELYNKDNMEVSVDAFLSAFYVNSSSDFTDPEKIDKEQSRVRIGYIPNWIGFNFTKTTDSGLTLGARSSFWVSVGDQIDDSQLTDSVVDTRQFYGTVSGEWGEVLFGKDFEVFSRTTVFNDVNLMGVGNVSQTLGVVDFEFVSFGNLGTGHTFPLPIGQITYRSPEMNGFKLAVSMVDPSKQARTATIDSQEKKPRFETELTYDREWQDGSLTGFLGGTTQESEQLLAGGDSVKSYGINYGVLIRQSGFVLHLSALDGSGIGPLINSQGGYVLNKLGKFQELDVKARLVQLSYTFGSEKLFISLGKTEQEGESALSNNTFDAKSLAVGWYHKFSKQLTLLTEYNHLEHKNLEEVDIVSMGIELTF
ncbi:porin [Shewanella sp. D64]|uniref:porin n=1 Tax=unclassified Shewanella TaxID=196818 RepID=UPI0022BA3358|nr:MULTISPECIES: porin [unclassified Shewanella]MEC4724695.1 porin [Shewanella sp. D64]MEC4736511.1 porin [Shewanella sp. E94]WBJ97436.1 porin [Shewanella sp. MTB7]